MLSLLQFLSLMPSPSLSTLHVPVFVLASVLEPMSTPEFTPMPRSMQKIHAFAHFYTDVMPVSMPMHIFIEPFQRSLFINFELYIAINFKMIVSSNFLSCIGCVHVQHRDMSTDARLRFIYSEQRLLYIYKTVGNGSTGKLILTNKQNDCLIFSYYYYYFFYKVVK